MEDLQDIFFDDLKACVHKAEEGGYWAEVPALLGCLTQGETLDEIVKNIDDAIAGWLSVQTRESLAAHAIHGTAEAPAASFSPNPAGGASTALPTWSSDFLSIQVTH